MPGSITKAKYFFLLFNNSLKPLNSFLICFIDVGIILIVSFPPDKGTSVPKTKKTFETYFFKFNFLKIKDVLL